MSSDPNKISRFWQELKRRKVIYVITVYASASFVVIELVNNVLEPLNLPEYISTIVIIALAVAFPIVIILSWIFDVTPKGLEKTKPAEAGEEEKGNVVVTSNSWRIATYVSVVIIAGLILFNIFSRPGVSDKVMDYGKSIAVLPLRNDSPDQENDYFINGIMESILDNLSKIKDLRVISRNTMEQYRDTVIPIPEIARAVKVNYVMEGSGQRIGDRIRITVQLIDQNDQHVWSKQYDEEISELEDLFEIQSDISKMVAQEIHSVITPEEMNRIERTPTVNSQAYQLYIQGGEVLKESLRQWNPEMMLHAKQLFHSALDHDSTLAEAWAGLGDVYLILHHSPGTEGRDSAKYWAEKALRINDQLGVAYRVLGEYYRYEGNAQSALTNYAMALKYNPNDALAYYMRGVLYAHNLEVFKAILDYEEALSRGPSSLIPGSALEMTGKAYAAAGFYDVAREYYFRALDFNGDSAYTFNLLANIELCKGNFSKASELEQKSYSMRVKIGWEDAVNNIIGLCNLIFSEQYEKAYEFAKLMDKYGEPNYFQNADIGLIYWRFGERERAEQYFNQIIYDTADASPELDVQMNRLTQSAIVYAFKEDSERAFAALDSIASFNVPQIYWIVRLENHPVFDKIRGEERFQDILQQMKDRWQEEHEKVQDWLVETGRL